MTATNAILFCIFILKVVENRVLGFHGAREGNATQALRHAIKLLESAIATSKADLDSTNIPIG